MFWALFWNGTLPVIQVACLAIVGVVLTKKGLLGAEARKLLTKLVYYAFVPAFIFTKLASSVTPTKALQWWPLVINMGISIAAGWALGKLMAYVTYATDTQRPILVAATALGNAGNMPLVLVAAIMSEGGWKLSQEEKDQGFAYVIMGMMVASFTHTAIGTALLRRSPDMERLPLQELTMEEGRAAENPRSPSVPPPAPLGLSSLLRRPREDRIQLLNAHPHSSSDPIAVNITGPFTLSDNEEPIIVGGAPGVTDRTGGRQNGATRRSNLMSASTDSLKGKAAGALGKWGRLTGPALREWVSLPSIACLAGLFVGMVGPLQDVMFQPGEPLSFISGVLSMLGGCAIPTMMLLMGASLSNGPGSGDVAPLHIVAVIACRQLLLPLLGLCIIAMAVNGGAFTCHDPLFLLVLLLQYTTPTAMNLHSLAVLHENGDMELSCLLFWQYISSLVTMPVFLMVYQHLIPKYCPVTNL